MARLTEVSGPSVGGFPGPRRAWKLDGSGVWDMGPQTPPLAPGASLWLTSTDGQMTQQDSTRGHPWGPPLPWLSPPDLLNAKQTLLECPLHARHRAAWHSSKVGQAPPRWVCVSYACVNQFCCFRRMCKPRREFSRRRVDRRGRSISCQSRSDRRSYRHR